MKLWDCMYTKTIPMEISFLKAWSKMSYDSTRIKMLLVGLNLGRCCLCSLWPATLVAVRHCFPGAWRSCRSGRWGCGVPGSTVVCCTEIKEISRRPERVAQCCDNRSSNVQRREAKASPEKPKSFKLQTVLPFRASLCIPVHPCVHNYPMGNWGSTWGPHLVVRNQAIWFRLAWFS